jgi:Putative prokaryotic signal transducing protein
MEIVDRDSERDEDLVQIAFTDTREEAALVRGLLREEGIRSLAKQGSINGPSLGAGLLTSSPRRIYVRPTDAARSRELLGEVMVEDPSEDEVPEPANAAYLAAATGHKPRDYSLLGAYTRAWVIGFAVLAVVLIVFLLVH